MKCKQCGCLLKNARTMAWHVRVVHKKRKDFKCPHCPKTFGQASNLSIHVRAVHEKKHRYSCLKCHYFTYTASNFRRHCRTARHNGACAPTVHVPNITLEEANELLALLQ